MDFTHLRNFLDHMAAERSPGNAVMVYQGGKPVFEYASGYADLESKTPLTGEEMFNIYSCSKITTVPPASTPLWPATVKPRLIL